jgi:sec-independent protein translocase protein TatB
MFDLGWSELLLIAVVAIIVVGPRDLPRMLRTVGQYTTKMRRMARDLQSQFNDALKEAELDEVGKEITELGRMNPARQIRDGLAKPLKSVGEALKTTAGEIEKGAANGAGREPTIEAPSAGGADGATTQPEPAEAPVADAPPAEGEPAQVSAKPKPEPEPVERERAASGS